MILESTITCPLCANEARERMPTDACQFFYDCRGCGQVLSPLPGDIKLRTPDPESSRDARIETQASG